MNTNKTDLTNISALCPRRLEETTRVPAAVERNTVCQAASHVADLHETQTVNEAHGQKEAGAGLAAGITVGFFQTVVFRVLSCLGVVA